jgi:hypothetical protein
LGQVPESALDRDQYICNQAHPIYAFDVAYKFHQVTFDVSQESFVGLYVHVIVLSREHDCFAILGALSFMTRLAWLKVVTLWLSGCKTCKKGANTMSQFMEHLADDVLPVILRTAFKIAETAWRAVCNPLSGWISLNFPRTSDLGLS